jgi:pimeloyl-ACP methyl ester carboxylesterase
MKNRFVLTFGLFAVCISILISISGCGLFVKNIPKGEIPNRTAADQFINIDGVNIHYKEYPADGPDVFMLHGLPSSMYTWEKVAPILQKNGYHVWLMDMKGFGWSDKPKKSNYDIETFANEVNTFMEAKGLKNLYFVGNSFGGGVATLMAFMHPDKMSKLALVDAAGYPQKLPTVIKLGRIPGAGEMMKLMYGKWMIRWNINEVMYDKKKITDEQITAYYDRIRSEGAMDALMVIVRGIDFDKYGKYINRVPEIKIPTLIVWGDTDRWVPIESGYKLKRNINDSIFVEISKCGHMPQEELPDETAKLLMDFFQDKPIVETAVPAK